MAAAVVYFSCVQELPGTQTKAKTTMDTVKLQAALDNGDIIASEATVDIGAKASPTGKEAVRPYTKYVATSATGMAVLCDGKIEPATEKPEKGDDTRTDEEKAYGACDFFNYGYDLNVRQRERQILMSELEGPEKVVKKMILGMVAADFDHDTIRATVKKAPKFAGVDGLDKMIETALKG